MKDIFSRGFHFIITGLPLITYPFVFIASIMSLAGEPIQGNFIADIIAVSFLWLSLFYPIAFVVCLVGFFISKQYKKIFVLSSYGYLALCVILFILWYMTGS